MIGRLVVSNMGEGSSDFVGTQCIYASDGTTRPFFGRKVIFSISDVPERFKESVSRFSKHACIYLIWVAFVRY